VQPILISSPQNISTSTAGPILQTWPSDSNS
jgi:hypothetical protein